MEAFSYGGELTNQAQGRWRFLMQIEESKAISVDFTIQKV